MIEGLSGAVLAGGQSRRMGADKAMLRVAGSTLIERAVASLASVCATVLIVGDRLAYRSIGPRVVADMWPGAGALGGIATALQQSADSHVLCVACDMPFLSTALLRAMAMERNDWDAVVPTTNDLRDLADSTAQIHPLHAIYARSALPTIQRRVEAGELRAGEAVRALNTRFLDEAWLRQFDPQLQSLINVNTRAEFETATRANG